MESIVEFRADAEAILKYRRLRLWVIDSLSSSRSLDELSDRVEVAIADYEWAIRKYGLETIIGSLSQILRSDVLASVVIGGGTIGFVAGEAAGMIAAATIGAGRIALWVANLKLQRAEIERLSPIAIISDIRALSAGK